MNVDAVSTREARRLYERGRWTLWLPRLPKSPNKLLGSHWRARHGETKAWNLLVQACCGTAPKPVKGRVSVRITQCRPRLLDPDNATASVKPILDALRYAGWLEDDTAELLDVEVRQMRRLKKEGPSGVYVEWRKMP